MNTTNFFHFINPFSGKTAGWQDFKNIDSFREKSKILFKSILAGFVGLGIGGLFAFRYMVEKHHFKREQLDGDPDKEMDIAAARSCALFHKVIAREGESIEERIERAKGVAESKFGKEAADKPGFKRFVLSILMNKTLDKLTTAEEKRKLALAYAPRVLREKEKLPPPGEEKIGFVKEFLELLPKEARRKAIIDYLPLFFGEKEYDGYSLAKKRFLIRNFTASVLMGKHVKEMNEAEKDSFAKTLLESYMPEEHKDRLLLEVLPLIFYRQDIFLLSRYPCDEPTEVGDVKDYIERLPKEIADYVNKENIDNSWQRLGPARQKEYEYFNHVKDMDFKFGGLKKDIFRMSFREKVDFAKRYFQGLSEKDKKRAVVHYLPAIYGEKEFHHLESVFKKNYIGYFLPEVLGEGKKVSQMDNGEKKAFVKKLLEETGGEDYAFCALNFLPYILYGKENAFAIKDKDMQIKYLEDLYSIFEKCDVSYEKKMSELFEGLFNLIYCGAPMVSGEKGVGERSFEAVAASSLKGEAKSFKDKLAEAKKIILDAGKKMFAESLTDKLPQRLYGKELLALKDGGSLKGDREKNEYMCLAALAGIEAMDSFKGSSGIERKSDSVERGINSYIGYPFEGQKEAAVKSAFEKVFSLYRKDSIERAAQVYNEEDEKFYLGAPYDRVHILKKLSEQYLEYLKKDPDRIRKAVKRNKELSYLKQLRDAGVIQSEESLFPQTLFEETFNQYAIPKNYLFPKRHRLVQEAIASGEMSQEKIEEILSLVTELEKKDVESLCRIKMFEIMNLLNQNFWHESVEYVVKDLKLGAVSGIVNVVSLGKDLDSVDLCSILKIISDKEGNGLPEDQHKIVFVKISVPSIYDNKVNRKLYIPPQSAKLRLLSKLSH